MNSMAKAFLLGLERSNMFVEVFTSGMEGEDWLQKPAGIPNPGIWIMGHLAFQRARFYELLTGKKTYDEDWISMFELGCEPKDAVAYPDIDSCRKFQKERLDDLKAYLKEVTEEELAAPTSIPSDFFKSRAAALVHLTHHEAHHTGELALIRRLLGKEKVI